MIIIGIDVAIKSLAISIIKTMNNKLEDIEVIDLNVYNLYPEKKIYCLFWFSRKFFR